MPTATTRRRSWTKWGASTYINVLKNAALDGRNAYQLNSGELSELLEMVDEGHYDRPSGWASNLLCAVYKVCRPPATGCCGIAQGEPQPRTRKAGEHNC
ncbi:MAG: hypothetical protein IPL52_10950 [Flavobacteriales bacterium]|nr:hypothetical protein [Flavobacteriales bacterium]